MDVFDQAKAVWSALDEMAAKNPEGYKKFIHEQLHGEETQEMLKKLKLGTGVGGGRSGPSEKKKAEGQQRQGVHKGTSGYGDKVLEGGDQVPSILTNIVDRPANQDEIGLKELRLPGGDKKTKIEKKLIEEL